MRDLKTQFIKDMPVFHNMREFADKTNIWYDGGCYTVPAVIDHKARDERETHSDYAEGIVKVLTVVYIAQVDLGFVPRKDHAIEIEESGEILTYNIVKSTYEDGEIILELEAYDE